VGAEEGVEVEPRKRSTVAAVAAKSSSLRKTFTFSDRKASPVKSHPSSATK